MSVIIAVVPFIIAGLASSAASMGAMANTEEDEQQSNDEALALGTNIRNEELLKRTLVNLGAKNISSGKNAVEGKIDAFHIVFEKTATGLFNIKFQGEITEAEAAKFRDELQQEYGSVVQDYIYTQLKQKAEQKGLSLEQETVQKDQSIVLTYNISSNG